MTYSEKAMLFKAVADSTRLEIVDMVSSGELCACRILEKFNITQPSLSHHMKILCGCGLVNGRKEGKWTYYSLDKKTVKKFGALLAEITSCRKNRLRTKTSCCKG